MLPSWEQRSEVLREWEHQSTDQPAEYWILSQRILGRVPGSRESTGNIWEHQRVTRESKLILSEVREHQLPIESQSSVYRSVYAKEDATPIIYEHCHSREGRKWPCFGIYSGIIHVSTAALLPPVLEQRDQKYREKALGSVPENTCQRIPEVFHVREYLKVPPVKHRRVPEVIWEYQRVLGSQNHTWKYQRVPHQFYRISVSLSCG
jgi:hypothetical protein